ncbi:MAG: 5-formyltetrahydrofolate cyclo-ligase [Acidiferrobacterales bacterium]|nr:5-formyltetrahydrofolate cyclo-ligase [Acidiferrobacterales bacterium]
MQTTDKTILRKSLRAKRRALSNAEQSAAADGLLQQLLTIEPFLNSQKVAMYLANDGEIAPSTVMSWMHAQKKQPFLPLVRQHNGRNTLVFAEAKKNIRYVENRYGISEPVVDEADLLQPENLDMVLLPLVGFDQSGNRIGMGGGFYDTTFEFLHGIAPEHRKPVLIGLAHECQKVEKIEAESWDIPLNIVVTDQHVHQLSR